MNNAEFGRPSRSMFIQKSLLGIQRQMGERASARERSKFVESKLWEMREIAEKLHVSIVYKDAQGSTRKILPLIQKPPTNAEK